MGLILVEENFFLTQITNIGNYVLFKVTNLIIHMSAFPCEQQMLVIHHSLCILKVDSFQDSCHLSFQGLSSMPSHPQFLKEPGM